MFSLVVAASVGVIFIAIISWPIQQPVFPHDRGYESITQNSLMPPHRPPTKYGTEVTYNKSTEIFAGARVSVGHFPKQASGESSQLVPLRYTSLKHRGRISIWSRRVK